MSGVNFYGCTIVCVELDVALIDCIFLFFLLYKPVCPLYYRKNLYCMRDSWIKKKKKKKYTIGKFTTALGPNMGWQPRGGGTQV